MPPSGAMPISASDGVDFSGQGSATHPPLSSPERREAARELTAAAALTKAWWMESGGRAQSSRPASSRRGGRILVKRLRSSPVDSISEM